MGSSASGSETSTLAIPQYLEDASRYNLNRGAAAANIGYVPKYGPDVAALTPLQLASINNLSQNANAFGMAGGNVTGGSGMPDPMEFAGGINAYSSAPAFQEMVSNLQANNPDKYNQIENYFKGGSATGGSLGSGGGYNTGGYNTGGSLGSGGNEALKTIAAIAGLGTAKSLLGGESVVGDNAANTALNLPTLNTLAPNAINAGAQFAAPAGYGVSFGSGSAAINPAITNLPAFGVDKVAPAINYGGLSGTTGGLTSNLPASFGSPVAAPVVPPVVPPIAPIAAPIAAPSVATGGLGTGGGTGMLGGLGALPTASQLAYLSPYFAAVPAMGMAAKYLLKPAVRGLTNFGSEEDAKREETAKFSKESGLDDYKAMAAASMGREGATYEDYIKAQRPPTSPYQAELDAIGDAGDRGYEEEQVLNRFQTPQGIAQMNQYYADNSKFFSPEGERIFPEGDMGDLQRASAEYIKQPIFGRDMRTGENPMSEYIKPVLNKDDSGRIIGKKRFYNVGGIVGNNPNPNGYFLGGITDGMTDEIPANIDGEQEAALSDGEFVIPADVVSHFGNGNSNAGADKLQGMMQDVRKARTGNKNQGIQINPNEYLLRT